ncbi:GTP cyclohydrolase II RibA [Acuticoccus yangtzensis]|uniref:GTP cyclohydrolase II RibA n=1 Tax=Acuticoccus yangtzensis TaxID=1443441 RepID=UPI00094975FC|nr:GTP cyclohydrolase II RibA [Acuticoccus yangtzensis]
MHLSEALSFAGLNLVAVTPLEIRREVVACVAFEPLGLSMGDFPHLAILFSKRDWAGEADIHKAVMQEFSGARNVLTRLHSECLLGDAFGSSMCDCGSQMRVAMEEMQARGEGLFIYLRQEGRGIGMRAKLDCLALQYGFVKGKRTARRHTSDEANLALGFDVDERSFDIAGKLLKALDIASVQLVTGNPRKIEDIAAEGVTIDETKDLWCGSMSARAAEEFAEKIARGYTYQR